MMPQQHAPPQVGHVEAFNVAKWQTDLNKIPSFSKFDGTTQHYRAWHMQFENYLSTVNINWVPVLKMVREMPFEIKSTTFKNTNVCLGLSGQSLEQLSSALWNVLTATLHELYLPHLEALSGGPTSKWLRGL